MRRFLGLFLFFSLPLAGSEVVRTVRAPFDHAHPNRGRFALEYLLGAPFDAKKPTILYITDAQQFQIRRGLMAMHQAQLFGDAFNVVGLVGRASSEELEKRVTRADGSIDWKLAYELLRYEQWIDDIDVVRRDLLGPHGKVLIYGRSGGGLLAHQYLSRYAKHVTRAFTQAAVNPFLEAELHINADRFAYEISATDPSLPQKLREILARNPADRLVVLKILQRQNFFVPLPQLSAERARVINELHAGNDALVAELRSKYQVDDSNALIASPRGTGVRVRLFEFYAPLARGRSEPAAGFSFDELLRDTAAPLLNLLARNEITAPRPFLANAHTAPTDVFVLAGRLDHTCDYRTQIALASHYPRHQLLIVVDDHMFHALNENGLYARLLRSVLLGRGVPADVDALVWRE